MLAPAGRFQNQVAALASVLALGIASAGIGFLGYEQVDPWRADLGPWPIPSPPPVASPTPLPLITSLPPAPVLGQPIELPSVLTAANKTGPVVTPDQANVIVGAWWSVNEDALERNNMVATDQLESGGFQQYSDGQTLDLVGRKLEWRTVRPLLDLRLFVPRQVSYPADFLAMVETAPYADDHSQPAGTRVIEFLVFQRASASDSWKGALEMDGYLTRWPPSAFATTVAGSPYEMPASGPFAVAPRELPGALASYWAAAYRSGTPPSDSPFANATFVNLSADAIYRDRLAWQSRTGLVGDVTYSVDPADPIFQFSINGSYVAVCFTVRMQSTTKHADNGPLHQDQARQNYGGRLPPGQYRAILAYGLHQTCVYVPPAGDSRPLVVQQVSGGDYREVPG